MNWPIFLINWMKNTLLFTVQYKYPDTFANRQYEQLSYPKNPKMWDPILVTLFENATPL